MWQTPSGARTMAVELAAVLLLAVAVADALGHASASFYLLVLGVPLTAAAGLLCFGRVLDAAGEGNSDPLGRLQACLATGLVLTIVVGAAIRGPVVPEGAVPGSATAVLAVSFGILMLQALVALAPARRQRA